jgi:hypothetical protein
VYNINNKIHLEVFDMVEEIKDRKGLDVEKQVGNAAGVFKTLSRNETEKEPIIEHDCDVPLKKDENTEQAINWDMFCDC